jgi:hypothetical protein
MQRNQDGSASAVRLAAGEWVIDVRLPEHVLHLDVHVPSIPGAMSRREQNLGDHTLTVSGMSLTRGDTRNAWITVIALAVLIDEHPELIMPGSKPSAALGAAARIWCGHGSNDWIQGQLSRAVAELGLGAGTRREKVLNAAREFYSDDRLDELRSQLLPFAPFGP